MTLNKTPFAAVIGAWYLAERFIGEEAPAEKGGYLAAFELTAPGQEAPVAIHSLTASDGEAAPRGLDFLLASDRINVAISRAQCLSIVVGSPQLATGISSSVANVKRLNRLCRLMTPAPTRSF